MKSITQFPNNSDHGGNGPDQAVPGSQQHGAMESMGLNNIHHELALSSGAEQVKSLTLIPNNTLSISGCRQDGSAAESSPM